MLTLILRSACFLVCGPFWRLGGWGTEGDKPNPFPWTGWRDLLIPLMHGLFYWYYTKSWILGLSLTIFSSIIRMGYGENSILQKRLGLDNIQARTVCGLIYGLVGLLPLAIYSGQWFTYAGMIILLGLVNFIVVRFEIADVPTELSIGWTYGLSFLLFIK